MKENNCTLFPDRSFTIDWTHCCKAHDIAYEEQVDRAQADADLYNCVYETGDGWLIIPSLIIAVLMYSGVRLFGSRFYKKNKIK